MAMAIRSVTLDTLPSPCLCFESIALQSTNVKVKGNSIPKARVFCSLELSSSFMGNWNGRAQLVRSKRKISKKRGMTVVDELGGTYEEGFEDVHLNLMNYFTYKAVRTVLTQLYEMNPPSYRWFYNFVASNNPKDGKYFLRALGKERQELAERVMITRLHLYGKWIKKCDHARMYQKISDENLELMRERLMETVIWPSDDTNTEKIG
ncbi:chaperonin-like RbcX protein 2, chloroplastic [Carex rostrata]